MAKKLKDNISSAYFDAAHKLYPRKTRRRIIAYVESYEDIAFWKSLLAEFENEERYFQVMLPSASSLTKGKKMVLLNTLNTAELGKSLIACVDSDYDFLMQGITPVSRKINNNEYIFQTYAYAIENYRCFAESLHGVCVQATLNDRYLINFNKFMGRYSEIAYPLFLWCIWFYRNKNTHSFSITDFNCCVRIRNLNIKNPYKSLDAMSNEVTVKLAELEKRYPEDRQSVIDLGAKLRDIGLYPDTTYLFIQGHHILDNVVLKILNPVCTLLRREREQEIRKLAEHNIHYRNELTSYQNSQSNVYIVLKKNTNFSGLYLYQWLRKDIQKFVDNL